ncbi:RelA/SpoT protein [Azospirillum brasilense]|nr:RelA/SpoT protein [Azospirillum brasilense]
MIDIVADFIRSYRRQYDFYRTAAQLCAQRCEQLLENNGVRAMVIFRAKRPDRLEDKLRKRNEKKKYTSVDDIYDDIVDLAGVRAALYFPADRPVIDRLFREEFNLIGDPKKFPDGSPPRHPYEKRFSGYWATHFRVTLRDDGAPAQVRYADARIEIQVASVLMHAWSEVEHDLVYKPLSGDLSEDELAVLDELNGLVLAGEIALERLQRAMEARVARSGAKFSNHYELAAFLIEAVKKSGADGEPILGRVDVLHRFLQRIGMDTPEKVSPKLAGLSPHGEGKTISEQIVDGIVDSDAESLRIYREEYAGALARTLQGGGATTTSVVGGEDFIPFMFCWTDLMNILQEAAIGAVPRVSTNISQAQSLASYHF